MAITVTLIKPLNIIQPDGKFNMLNSKMFFFFWKKALRFLRQGFKQLYWIMYAVGTTTLNCIALNIELANFYARSSSKESTE